MEPLDLEDIRAEMKSYIIRIYFDRNDRRTAFSALERLLKGGRLPKPGLVTKGVLAIREDIQLQIRKAILRRRPDLVEEGRE